ncbi:MAG TPA: response regulator [Clostridiales bacterium]|nr:response regulator [Clostridiales bacterium]
MDILMYKILIAEDESEMRNLLVKYIKKQEPDMEVIGGAVNGKEALRLTELHRPDIVITDIAMPVMDGLEFLQEAAKKNIPLKVVIISGHDEFEYAKKAIALGVSEYLLKPFEPLELKKVLEKIKKELERQNTLLDNMKLLKEKVDGSETVLKERILRDIVLGKKEVPEPKADILDTEADYYCICLLKLPLYFTASGWNMEKRDNIEELVKILSGGCIHKDIQVQGLGLEDNGAILILAGRALEKQQFFYKVRESMEHLQRSMEKYYDVRLICIIGGIYVEWRKLSESYEETLKVWKGLTSTDKSLIICGEEKMETPSKGIVDSSKQIKNLKEQILLSVRMGKGKESVEHLDELIQVYASISPRKTDFVAISAQELVYGIFNEIEQNDIRLDKKRTNEEIQSRLRQQLRNASLLEIRELLRSYFEMCHRSFMESKDRRQTEVIVEHIKNLIECNLEMEELTLEWIAEKIHFSSTYVRQIFKQKTGERIMEYVIRKRMEKAGGLLRKTDLKIQDVAEACGYSNQRYFASSFKKYYGCTPTEYKIMLKEEDY